MITANLGRWGGLSARTCVRICRVKIEVWPARKYRDELIGEVPCVDVCDPRSQPQVNKSARAVEHTETVGLSITADVSDALSPQRRSGDGSGDKCGDSESTENTRPGR